MGRDDRGDGGPTGVVSHRTLAGRYRLTGLLGQGGAAAVYTATDLLLEREVAVKVLNHSAGADEATRFVAQARVLSQLNHPSIVRVFDADIDADAPYLVMELVRGTPLCDLLAGGPLPPERVAHVGGQLAAALVHAHERGVVHRDVKPRNVLLEAGDTARLADFGIVGLPEATRVTVTGQLLGAPAYVAPEQVRGDEVGPPADVYALGLLLLEALTGRLPFPGTPIESALARLERDVTVSEELPGSWRHALGAMTRREPAARPSAATVQAWLAAPDVVALHAPAAPVATAPAPEPVAVPPRRHRAVRSAPARGSRIARWHRRSTSGVAWFATAAAMLVVALSGTDLEALVRPLRAIIAPSADAAAPDPSVGNAVARAADVPGALGETPAATRGDAADRIAARSTEVRDSTTERSARPALEVADAARGDAARGRETQDPVRTSRPSHPVRDDAGRDEPAGKGGGPSEAPPPATDPGAAPEPGAAPGPAPAPDPGTDPGTDPGSDPGTDPGGEAAPRPPSRNPEPPRSGPGEPVRGESPREGTGAGRDVGPPPDAGPGRDVGPPADAGPSRAIGVPAERVQPVTPPTVSSGAAAAAAARGTAAPDERGDGEG